MYRYLIAAVLGFLSGSVMYSYYLPLVFCHVDIIKESEDHNPGMANAALCGGRVIGGICLVLDVLKGFLPVFISARVLDSANPLFGLAVAAPVLGHAFTPLMRFHGGKAISPAFGALIGLWQISGIICALAFPLIFTTFILTVHPHSLRMIIASCALAATALISGQAPGVAAGAVCIASVLIYKHAINYDKKPFSLRLFVKIPLYQSKKTRRQEE